MVVSRSLSFILRSVILWNGYLCILERKRAPVTVRFEHSVALMTTLLSIPSLFMLVLDIKTFWQYWKYITFDRSSYCSVIFFGNYSMYMISTICINMWITELKNVNTIMRPFSLESGAIRQVIYIHVLLLGCVWIQICAQTWSRDLLIGMYRVDDFISYGKLFTVHSCRFQAYNTRLICPLLLLLE